jgi:hypothetical protein
MNDNDTTDTSKSSEVVLVFVDNAEKLKIKRLLVSRIITAF